MFNFFRDFLDFIRVVMSAFSSLAAVIGYLLFNPPGIPIIFAGFSAFCAVAASRAYNSRKDTKEDTINRKRVNSFSFKKEGILIIVFLYIVGLFFSLFLGTVSVVFYLVFMFVGIVYTLFRLNARSFSHLFKNLYGAFGISLVFLLGAGMVTTEIFIYCFLLALFVIASSIVADLRDYRGDIKVRKRTLPTVLGRTKAKVLSSTIFSAFSLLILILYIKAFLLFAVFSFVVILLVLRNKPRLAHFTGSLSILPTTAWIWIIIG